MVETSLPVRDHGAEGAQRAALREPQGDHGRQEETDRQEATPPASASTRQRWGLRGPVVIQKLEPPPPKPAGKVFKDDVATAVKEVARLLHEEAKVI